MHYLNSQIKLYEATSVISHTFCFQPNLISTVKVVIFNILSIQNAKSCFLICWCPC